MTSPNRVAAERGGRGVTRADASAPAAKLTDPVAAARIAAIFRKGFERLAVQESAVAVPASSGVSDTTPSDLGAGSGASAPKGAQRRGVRPDAEQRRAG